MRVSTAILAFLILGALPAGGEPPRKSESAPIVIDDSLGALRIGRHFEYYEDRTKQLVMEEVTSEEREWQRSVEDSLGFGFTPSAYWMRFAVCDLMVEEKAWYLEIDYPLIDSLELHIPDEQGGFKLIKAGDNYSFNKRKIKDRNYIFKIDHQEGDRTYYLRFETTSSLNFTPVIMSEETFLNRYITELPIFWAYYGLMGVMIFYNLVIFIWVRVRKHIYYSLFIGFFALFQFTLNGFSFQYLWPNWIWWANNCLPFFMCMTLFWVSVFLRNHIDLKIQFPKMNKVMLVGLFIPIVIGMLLSLLLPYRASISMATALAGYSAAVLFTMGIYVVAKGSRVGRIDLFGFACLAIGVFLYVLKTFDYVPVNFITNWGIQIGSALVVVLLSLSMADEINSMKNELQDLNENLEKKVDERTRELKEARDALWGEMQLAKKIQTVLLPEKPEIPGYQISAYMSPADDVGGDYYDIINVEGNDWVVIGDVSGHGVPAGLVMMMVQTAIRTVINQNPDVPPMELLNVINKTIRHNLQQLKEDRYMTITVFASFKQGKFNFSGHHQDIIIHRGETDKIDLVETYGMWIGIMDDISDKLDEGTLTLHVGDTMLIYTDGIIEAWRKGTVRDERDPDLDMFGVTRLSETFSSLAKQSLHEIKRGILKALVDYDCPDDITMVLVRRMS